jgi:hypothetical protein
MRIEEGWGGPGFEPWNEKENIQKLAQQNFGGLTQDRDLANFVRSERRKMQSRSTPPEPDVPLPAGCHWQLVANNEWVLLVPCGRAGFMQYSGSQSELEEFAKNLAV